jgi:hypothetical protein
MLRSLQSTGKELLIAYREIPSPQIPVLVSFTRDVFWNYIFFHFSQEGEQTFEKEKKEGEEMFEKKNQNNTLGVDLALTLKKQFRILKQCFPWDEPKNFPPFSMPHKIHLG